MGNQHVHTISQVQLLQRHINRRDQQLKQYRADLQDAEHTIEILRAGLEMIKDKYMNLGLEIEKPIETKLLCGNIIQDVKAIEETLNTTHAKI